MEWGTSNKDRLPQGCGSRAAGQEIVPDNSFACSAILGGQMAGFASLYLTSQLRIR